jgi:glycosyltransferase involved in cell wall biosynthesis
MGCANIECMKLSLIIPVFNEADHLNQFFEKLIATPVHDDIEYVVIDDYSTDTSWEIVTKWAEKNSRICCHRQSVNSGKGSALHKGIELASGGIIAIQDADFEYDPRDLKKLIQPVIANQADVVFGNRFAKNRPQVHRTMHYVGNRLLTLFSNIMSGLYLGDMETCYKVFRADLLKPLELVSKRFGFEPEITAKIAKLKVRIEEYPISYVPRTYLEGKKIGWRDGVAALWFIVYFNLSPLSQKSLKALPRKYRQL